MEEIPLPPLGKPLYIQCHLPTSKQIRARSVLTVETPDDLNSNKLGVSEWKESCLTCDNFLKDCPGHDGSLELPIPIYRIFFVKDLLNILNCICFYCQRIRLPTKDRRYAEIRAMPMEVRLENLEQACRAYRYCGMTTREVASEDSMSQKELKKQHARDICGPCYKMHVEFKNEDRDSTFIRAKIHLDDNDYASYRTNASWKPVTIGPRDIFDCLQQIGPEARYMLGTNEWNEPAARMWDVLPIPSLNTRPCHTFDGIGAGKKRIFNDWTKFLRIIVMARNKLRDAMQKSDEKVTCCHYVFKDIESRSFSQCFQYGYMSKQLKEPHKIRLKADLKKTNYGSIEAAWRDLNKFVAAFHSHRHKKCMQKGSYGKPLTNVEDRYKFQKSGRFRSSITARRVNNGGRGVLEGGMNQPVDQVYIPRKEAMNVTMKIFVTKLNMTLVQKWILNGPYVYPGANYVTLKDGVEVNLGFHENRRDINLSDVLYVRRHLIDGDPVMVGRQPTLHRASMMTFHAKIVDGYVIRLHYAVFTPLGADCDGDEVNFQVLQTDEALAEARELSCVKNNIMKDGNIWIKFIQNSVVGAYLLTRPGVLLEQDDVSYITEHLPGCELPKPIQPGQWSGHQLVSLLFPKDFTLVSDKLTIRNGHFIQGVLNNSTLNGANGVLYHLHRDYADKSVTLEFIHQAYILFQKYLDLFGHSAGYYDCAIDFHDEDASNDEKWNSGEKLQLQEIMRTFQQVQTNIDKMNEYADKLTMIPGCTGNDTETNLRDHIDKIVAMSTEAVMKYHEHVNERSGNQNGILHMIKSGAKGSASTLNQMCGIVGQIYVTYSRFNSVSSHFLPGQQTMIARGNIRECYANGLPLTAVISEAPATCESVVNKNKGTSKSGYTIRKITTCMMGIVPDYLGRVVDTNERIIWSTYGNDNYDAQAMVATKIRLLTWSESDILTEFGTFIDEKDAPALRGASERRMIMEMNTGFSSLVRRPEWAQQASLESTRALMSSEVGDLLRLRQRLRFLLARCNDRQPLNSTRAPFDFEHLMERCEQSVRVDTSTYPLPHHYREFAVRLWDRLIQDKLVVSFNLCFKALFFDWLGTRHLMKRKFTFYHLRWLADHIVRLLARTLIQPGESVGVMATQNMGEPFAQLTLKTPHFSGKFSNVVAGTVRIQNIIDCNFCDPQMTIVLEEEVRTKTEADIFGISLTSCYLKDILSSYPLHDIQREACHIHFQVDRQKTIQHLVSLRSAVKILASQCHIPLHNFRLSYLDEPEWFIHLTIPYHSDFWSITSTGLGSSDVIQPNVVAHNIIYNLSQSVVIHGLPCISKFVTEEITISTEFGDQKRWSINTLGSNLRYVMRLPKVDSKRTVSNNITEMCDVLGLHAARKALENEFLMVMGDMVDARHIKLISRMMASDLYIQGMKIKQTAQNIPPLQRAAYEQASKQMIDYCSVAAKDDGKTICGAVLLNKRMAVGTTYKLDMIPMNPFWIPDRLQFQWDAIPDQMSTYVFSPRLDGTRFFLVFYQNRQKQPVACLVDREYRVFSLPVTDLPDFIFSGTVIDGDLCVTKDQEPVFVASDCLMSCGNRCSVYRFDQRIEIAREVLWRMVGDKSVAIGDLMGTKENYCLPIALRAQMSYSFWKIGKIPFRVFVKPIFDLCGLSHYAEHWLPVIPFPVDGLIFTSLIEPLYPFKMKPECSFQWKPKEFQSIDFFVSPAEEDFKPLDRLDTLFSGNPRSKNKWKFLLPLTTIEQYRILYPITPLEHNYHLWVRHEQNLVRFTFAWHENRQLPRGVYQCHWRDAHWIIGRPRHKDADQMEVLVHTIHTMSENIDLHEIG